MIRSMTFVEPDIYSFLKAQDPARYARALRVRTEVFVDEQNVDPAHEVDAIDEVALHWSVEFEGETLPAATGRMFPDPGNAGAMRIGRMAVRKPFRGQGLGRLMLEAMLKEGERQGYREAVCDAQTHALAFYAGLGFVAEGDEFLDENIPHYLMRRPFPVRTGFHERKERKAVPERNGGLSIN